MLRLWRIFFDNPICSMKVPSRSRKCQIWKAWSLSFHWKKIMLIYFFDNFVQWYEIQMLGLVFEKLFQAQKQMFSSTRIPDQIDETSSELKNWSEKTFLWFFSQWKLRFHTFQISHLGDRGGTAIEHIELQRLFFKI